MHADEPLSILLLGFGNVGRELVRLLARAGAGAGAGPRTAHGLGGSGERRIVLAGVVTGSHGALVAPEGGPGLSPAEVLAAWQAGGFSRGHPAYARIDAGEAVSRLAYDALVEASPLNVAGRGEPARSWIRAALQRGRHAVTCNKGPVAWGYRELSGLARERGVALRFESTVMDGVPVFHLARCGLQGASVLSVEGILNSTTNVVLEEAATGRRLEQGIARASELGIAESDPSDDLAGWDAAVKLSVLANVLLVRDGEAELRPEAVEREEVDGATVERARSAGARGRSLKMVCAARRVEGAPGAEARIQARLAARELPPDHPFAGVSGASSILRITAEPLGSFTVTEEDPDLATTAFGVLADLLSLEPSVG